MRVNEEMKKLRSLFSIIQHKKVSDIVSAKKMSAFLRGRCSKSTFSFKFMENNNVILHFNTFLET